MPAYELFRPPIWNRKLKEKQQSKKVIVNNIYITVINLIKHPKNICIYENEKPAQICNIKIT